jgi:hypothetical protein
MAHNLGEGEMILKHLDHRLGGEIWGKAVLTRRFVNDSGEGAFLASACQFNGVGFHALSLERISFFMQQREKGDRAVRLVAPEGTFHLGG